MTDAQNIRWTLHTSEGVVINPATGSEIWKHYGPVRAYSERIEAAGYPCARIARHNNEAEALSYVDRELTVA